ncbi:MAG: class I SAM-dependent methyltransferase [Planctomycetes bacterium]|nr:class I SAM-dependent methyltransferase [Planctomycetota bacterium]
MSGFADHFSRHAPEYAAFRPHYPPALVAWIASLARDHALAWDVGTGSGQAARLLAPHFERVIATDASAEQLAHAEAHTNVEYGCAPAESSGLASASVDLVTVAAAIHWFDHPRFYAEVQRVLRPGGVIAVWSYDLVHVSPAIDAITEWFYEERVGRYWPAGRRHVETRYRELPFPFEELPFGDWAIEAELDRAAFVGYVGTWSAVGRARQAEGRDPLPEFEARVAPLWPDAKATKPARWPLFARVGRWNG